MISSAGWGTTFRDTRVADDSIPEVAEAAAKLPAGISEAAGSIFG
jgi:hypothetical protein